MVCPAPVIFFGSAAIELPKVEVLIFSAPAAPLKLKFGRMVVETKSYKSM